VVQERVPERALASPLARGKRAQANPAGVAADPRRRMSTLSATEVLALQQLAGNRATAARIEASRVARGPRSTAAHELAGGFAPGRSPARQDDRGRAGWDRGRARPAAIQRQTSGPGPAPRPGLVGAHVGTATGTTAARFLSTHGTELARIVAEPGELKLLLEAVIARGILDADYSEYWMKKTMPLTPLVFRQRHPDKTPLRVRVADYGTPANRAKWPANNLNEQDWVELNSINQNLVYPLLAFVVPRITAAPAVSEKSAVGEKIAAVAHNYLGLKYAKGSMVCTELVKKVFKDLGLGLKARIGNVASIEKNSANFGEVSAAQAGDLLTRKGRHVAIYAGSGKVIHAPYTGTVVRLDPYKADKWDKVLRYQPAR